MENETNIPEEAPGATYRQGPAPAMASSFNNDDIRRFYRQGLPELLKKVFTAPVAGTYSIFISPGAGAYFNALVLTASTALLYIIVPYLMIPSGLKEHIGFGIMLKVGLSVALLMLLIPVVSFGIKSLSRKPVLRNELLTGGLCGIPLTGILLLLVVARIFRSNEERMMRIAYDPASIISDSMPLLLIAFYLLLMMIDMLRQSLKAGGTKDALAWYISPAGILLSFYLAFKIAVALF